MGPTERHAWGHVAAQGTARSFQERPLRVGRVQVRLGQRQGSRGWGARTKCFQSLGLTSPWGSAAQQRQGEGRCHWVLFQGLLCGI